MLRVRSVDERIIEGRIVPYGERIQYRGEPEEFAPGALAGTDPTRIKLLRDHDSTRAIGVGIEFDDRDDGAHMAFKVARTAAGDELLELAAAGVVDAFSAGWSAEERSAKGIVTKADIMEVSAVTWGAYPSARVLATRNQEEHMTTEPEPAPDEEPEPEPEGNGAELKLVTRIDQFEDTMRRRLADMEGRITSTPRPLPRVSPAEWLQAEARSMFYNDPSYRTRALADLTGDALATGAPDLSPFVLEEFLGSQLVNVLDTRRPVFASAGSFPMPRGGSAIVPVISQHTLVAARGVQKTQPPTREMQATEKRFDAKWYAGAVDVSLELIATADIGIVEMVFSDLAGQYAIATEAAAIVDIEGTTGTTTAAGTLDTATYAGFVKDIAVESQKVRVATGAPANRLAIPWAKWPDVLSLVDTTGRRVFATNGAANADASADITAESFTISGIVVFPAGVTAPLLYNTDALRVADGGISRVEAVNVALLGRDLGVLGRTLVVPRIPAGIVEFPLV